MEKCLYCNQDEARNALMVPICELEYSQVFLLKNQNYPGRCVVTFKEHKEELFQLTADEQTGFMNDMAQVSKVIYDMFAPAKLNYAIYGDGVPHLHCHIVPKTKDGYCWGRPFEMNGNDHFLTDAEATELAGRIRDKLIVI
ncbi:HIT family protein [Oscillospiraceae bacterium MB08-C2-2]|nr:HIT family protein [Oscillospiraceae bacterium MB08-C2-2]